MLALLKICPSFAPPINVLHMLMGTLEKDMETGVSLGDARKTPGRNLRNFKVFMETSFEKIANIGAEFIKDGDNVFMFSMSSSVWKVLR